MSDFITQIAARKGRLGRAQASGLSPAVPAVLAPSEPSPSTEEHAERLRRHQCSILRDSGLFDEAFYLEAYPDTATSELSPLEHFFGFGWKEGRRPNAFFDPAWYLAVHEEASSSGMQPLLHYALKGEAAGLKPSLIFDPLWYRQAYNLPEGASPLAHYLANRRSRLLSPVAAFDVDYYASNYPDVAAAGVDLFEHYVHSGIKEGRAPSREFDARYYVNRHMAGDKQANAFLHYLENRGKPGILGRLPESMPTMAREAKKWSRPGPSFEERTPLSPAVKPRVLALTYYLPQFHAFAENDEWWGKGFTEWTNLVRGMPRYVGHQQPRIPRDLGFYTLDGLAPMRAQVAMAREAGIGGFVFYHYWFNGRRLMNGPVDRFLADPSVDFPFALMWANENWTRRWDGAEEDVLISQDYRESDDAALAADFARHFRDRRYIRLDGRPLLMVYRPGIIPEPQATMARLRAEIRKVCSEDPLLIMAQAFGDLDPALFGFDGAIEFPPHKLTTYMLPANERFEYLDPDFSGKIYGYDEVVRESLSEGDSPFPLIKTAVPGWDNDARRQGTGLSLAGATPAKYEAWLTTLADRAVAKPFFGTPVIAINAWNEWCEGAYLEPDTHSGCAYLNATARAVTARAKVSSQCKFALIGHDAFPSGAQHLLLNIGRTLRRLMGAQVEYVLLGDGAMLPEYRAEARTSVCATPEELSARVRELSETGFRTAVVNTSAAAWAVAHADAVGVRAILLVHEMRRTIEERHLGAPLTAAMEKAALTVFGASEVRNDVMAVTGRPPIRTAVRPQGSYLSVEPDLDGALRFRADLGIPEGDALVLGAGYADLRKGFDLFMQVWRECRRRDAGRTMHFAWLGGMDPGMATWLGREIEDARATGTFHLPGFRRDMAAALTATDAFALTSREDPLPTVVMEAMEAGAPTFAFEGSGGIPGLMRTVDEGITCPHADAAAMADAIAKAVRRGEPPETRLARSRDARTWFNFDDYVRYLADACAPGSSAASVAVPAYNYGRYMEDRLRSVFAQDRLVAEVIVLDDRSTDDTEERCAQASVECGRSIQFIRNEVNSGSVFKQWRKAADMAKGEYLWIAEADDLTQPSFLSRLTAMLDSEPYMAFAFCDSSSISAEGQPVYPNYKAYYTDAGAASLMRAGSFDGEAFAVECLSVRNLILNVSAVVWRREALAASLDRLAAEMPNFRMAGDWMLYLDAACQPGARVGYEAEPLNVHRRHSTSVTHALDADRHVHEIEACHAWARTLIELGPEVCERQAAYLADVDASLRERQVQEKAAAPAARAGRPAGAKTVKRKRTK